MGMSGSSTKTKVTPYDPAAIKGASTALQGGYDASKQTLAQWSPALNAAIQHISDNIDHPPSYMGDAAREMGDTINGKYLGPASNPHAAGMAKIIADQTAGEYNSTYGSAGRAHGGMAALLSSRGVGDALNNFYGNIYQAERGRQFAATQGAPAFHEGEYSDINHLFPAVQGAAGMPLNIANSYSGGIGGLLSPYTTSTTTQKQAWGPQLLGAAMAIGGAAMGNPMALGGLSGLMGGGGPSPIAVNPTGTSNYFASQPNWGFGG